MLHEIHIHLPHNWGGLDSLYWELLHGKQGCSLHRKDEKLHRAVGWIILFELFIWHVSDGVTLTTLNGMTLTTIFTASFLSKHIYIYIFKLVQWRKICIGFWVASKLSDVSFEGAESRWGDDLVSVHQASCDGQRFKQENLKGLSWSSH